MKKNFFNCTVACLLFTFMGVSCTQTDNNIQLDLSANTIAETTSIYSGFTSFISTRETAYLDSIENVVNKM